MRAALVSLVLAMLASAASAGALDDPPFTAKPNAVLAAAAKSAAVDAPVVVLRDEVTITLDERGRATRRYRVVAVINKPSGADDWGTLYVGWSPFYQDKPTIRARVIAPDGKVAELDPSLIQDTPAEQPSAVIFSDRRTLTVPLPRLSVGAVFEEEFVIVDREPLLDAGVVFREYAVREVPVERLSVTIDAPTKLGARVVARGFAKTAAPRKVTRGARTTWTYVVDAPPPVTVLQPNVPPDVATLGYVGVATAPSWNAVATGYDAVVGARLAEPFTAPAGITGATPRATLDQAVAWLHANVRYTGIELEDSAIIPFPPAQTVARGFGDCKDKAALLVALLRAAKIEAHLALLSTGPGTDVDTDLPGMGAFDHAIVRARIDGKDVWIDATEDGLPAGQLPARDQGRRALIVAPGTRDLVVTPVAPARDNLVREVRTYHLAELEGARVVEVTREHGVFHDNMRAWFRNGVRADIGKDLGTYAERQYHGKLVRFDGPLPAKATDPFDVTIEVAAADRAYTGREQVDVFLFPADTLGRLGDSIRSLDREGEAALAARTFDYVWPAPFVYEIENRLVLPPGYDAPALVASDERKLGTMTLTTTRRIDGGAAVITYRLDTGKPRITTAELRATRQAVKALAEEEAEHVIVPQTGAALMHQTKMREAIREYQRLIALHPREALHHSQLAEAYRRAGMSAAARRAAKKAVAVEPGSGDAYSLLGFHLSRDTIGRAYGHDADRPGSIAAYRKAIALRPDHLGALEDLAAVLSVDERGWPTTSARDLREAAALLRKVHDGGREGDQLFRAAGFLLRAGDAAEAEQIARALPASELRSALLVAIVAVARGPGEANALAKTLATGDARTQVLIGARGWLYIMRRYDEMRAIMAETPPSPDDAEHRALLQKVREIDLGKLDPADPQTPALLMMASFFGYTPPSTPWAKDLGAEVIEMGLQGARGVDAEKLREMPLAIAIDSMLSPIHLTVEGDAGAGWRVIMNAGAGRLGLHVVRGARGTAELVAVEGLAGGFGRQILNAVARKDLVTARRWLERVAEGPPVSTPIRAVARLVTDEVTAARPASRDLLELAGAILLVDMDPAAAIPVLRRCKTSHAATQQVCRDGLIQALRARRAFDDIPPIARQLPTSTSFEVATRARHLALGDAGAEAIELVDAALAKSPDDKTLILARTFLAVEVEGWPAAQPWYAKATAHQHITAGDLNNLAWTRLFHDPAPDQAHDLAERAAHMSRPMSPFLAHTRATIAAESDDPHQAMLHLEQSHRRLPWEPPASADWYVYGRVAESYGLRDDAIAFYRRVERSEPTPGQPTTFDFARRALTRLGAKP